MSHNISVHPSSIFKLLIEAADLLLMGRQKRIFIPPKLLKLFTVLTTALLKGDYPF